jgi:hypothetical protein
VKFLYIPNELDATITLNSTPTLNKKKIFWSSMLNNCPKVGKKNNPTCGNWQSLGLARIIMMQYRLFEYVHVYIIYVCLCKSPDEYAQNKAITKVSMNNSDIDALFEYITDEY